MFLTSDLALPFRTPSSQECFGLFRVRGMHQMAIPNECQHCGVKGPAIRTRIQWAWTPCPY